MANDPGRISVWWRCSLVLALFGVLAGGAKVASAIDATAEQSLREELRAVIAEMVRSGAFGDTSAPQIALTLDMPAQRVSDLGLLVDSAATGRDGLRVLAVTPGGNAERMGLRGGDEVLTVNGVALSGSKAAAMLRGTIDALPNGAALSFEVRRDGATRRLAGAVSAVELPPMRLTIGDDVHATTPVAKPQAASDACGRISEFDVAPRQQGLHAATLIAIDDALPGPSGSTSFKVKAGHHRLTVAERIEPKYLAFNDRLRNSGPRSRYKTLEVDVAADTTLFVSAQLIEARRNEWRDGAYWEPVVWKTTAEPCR